MYDNLDFILVNPRNLENYVSEHHDICLGLGYIHSVACKNGHKGIIINCSLNNYSSGEAADMIIKFNPLIVGISCNFFSSLPGTVELVDNLRSKKYLGHISVGGHGAFSCRHKLIEILDIDSICLGDGEVSFSTLITQIKNGIFINSIEGFLFKTKINNIIDLYQNIQLPELNNITYPTRPGEKGYHVNMNASSKLDRFKFDISTTRGCTYNCSYCDICHFYSKTRRTRDVLDVVNEIEYLYRLFEISSFSFSDDNFLGGINLGKKRAIEFEKSVSKLSFKISFHMEARVTDVISEIMLPLKLAGLTGVNLGVESGSQATLDRWRKGITVEQSKRAISYVMSLGLMFNVNFILYDMYTTIEELYENYVFLKESGAYLNSEHYISLYDNCLGVISGTDMEKELRDFDLLLPYKMDKATEFEIMVINKFQPIYSYKFVNVEMEYFEKNQNYWLNLIYPYVDYYSNFSKSKQRKIRTLCLILYKESIDLAKNKIVDYEKLNRILLKYEHEGK